MDHADRIPIDLGYEVATSSDTSQARTTVKEDGSVVINVLVQSPCDPAVESDVIVVCAPAPADEPVPGTDGTFTQEGFTPELELAPNAKAKVRAETVPESGADRVMIDIIYRF